MRGYDKCMKVSKAKPTSTDTVSAEKQVSAEEFNQEIIRMSKEYFDWQEKVLPYFNTKSIEEIRREKSSNSLLIAAPGPGIIDYYHRHHQPDKHDQLALSYAALIFPESKFIWNEAFCYGFQTTDYKSIEDNLRESEGIISAIYFMISRKSSKKRQNISSIFSICSTDIFPFPSKQINPTIISFFGTGWPNKTITKLLIKSYISFGHYKNSILNLRGSMLRCISLAFAWNMRKSLLPENPETNEYFFSSEEEKN